MSGSIDHERARCTDPADRPAPDEKDPALPMALPWPHNTPTLPRVALTDLRADHPATTARTTPEWLVRAREIATSPVTALVVMLLGLLGLFVLPMVGLPFVALVVLPIVIYQLRAEQRHQLRVGRR
ncbi:MAG: hypothetical protein QOE59_4140 [Actinomycetota bacterium]|jgi:hypothetical protein|nr:hypothetical protein [Actinomycetota bacterium]